MKGPTHIQRRMCHFHLHCWVRVLHVLVRSQGAAEGDNTTLDVLRRYTQATTTILMCEVMCDGLPLNVLLRQKGVRESWLRLLEAFRPIEGMALKPPLFSNMLPRRILHCNLEDPGVVSTGFMLSDRAVERHSLKHWSPVGLLPVPKKQPQLSSAGLTGASSSVRALPAQQGTGGAGLSAVGSGGSTDVQPASRILVKRRGRRVLALKPAVRPAAYGVWRRLAPIDRPARVLRRNARHPRPHGLSRLCPRHAVRLAVRLKPAVPKPSVPPPPGRRRRPALAVGVAEAQWRGPGAAMIDAVPWKVSASECRTTSTSSGAFVWPLTRPALRCVRSGVAVERDGALLRWPVCRLGQLCE